MDIIVALWLVCSAFILGANTGTPEGESAGVEDLIEMREAHLVMEVDADARISESILEHACSTGPQGRIYRGLTSPHVRNRD